MEVKTPFGQRGYNVGKSFSFARSGLGSASGRTHGYLVGFSIRVAAVNTRLLSRLVGQASGSERPLHIGARSG